MTIYKSRVINTDPLPYVDAVGVRTNYAHGASDKRSDPRPKFDHPVNPILVDFRDYWRHVPRIGPREAATYLEVCYMEGAEDWTPEQVDHATRVLTRLANWSPE